MKPFSLYSACQLVLVSLFDDLFYLEMQVSGWFEEYEGLTFATFRGAGHAVPCFKPSNSLAFFSSFLLGESPPSTK